MKYFGISTFRSRFASLVAIVIIIFAVTEIYVVKRRSSKSISQFNGQYFIIMLTFADIEALVRSQAQNLSPPSDQNQRLSQLFFGFHTAPIHTRVPHRQLDAAGAATDSFISFIPWQTQINFKDTRVALVIGLQQLPKSFLIRSLNEIANYVAIPGIISDSKLDRGYRNSLNMFNADVWRHCVSQALSSTRYQKSEKTNDNNYYMWLRSVLSDQATQTKLRAKGFEDENLLIWSLLSAPRFNSSDTSSFVNTARSVLDAALTYHRTMRKDQLLDSFGDGAESIALRDTYLPLTLPIWLQALSESKSVICILIYRDPYQLFASTDPELLRSLFDWPGDIRVSVTRAWRNVMDVTMSSCGNAGRPIIVIHQDRLLDGGVEGLLSLEQALASSGGYTDTKTPSISLVESMAKLRKSYPYKLDNRWRLDKSDDLLMSTVEHLRCEGSFDHCQAKRNIGLARPSTSMRLAGLHLYRQADISFYVFSDCEDDYCCVSNYQLSTIETIFFHYPQAHLTLYVHGMIDDVTLNGLKPLADIGYDATVKSDVSFVQLVNDQYHEFVPCLLAADRGSLLWKLMSGFMHGGVAFDLGTAFLRLFPPSSSFFSYVPRYGPSIAVISVHQPLSQDLFDIIANHCFADASFEQASEADLVKSIENSRVFPVLRRGFLTVSMSNLKSVLVETQDSSQRIFSYRLPVATRLIDRLNTFDSMLVSNGVMQGIHRFKDYASAFLSTSNPQDEPDADVIDIDVMHNGSFIHLFPDLIQGSKIQESSYLEQYIANLCVVCNKWTSLSTACPVPPTMSSDPSQVTYSTLLSREFKVNPGKYFYIWTTEAASFQNWRPRFLESIFLHHPHASVEVFSNSLAQSAFSKFSCYDLKVSQFDVSELFQDTPLEVLLPRMNEFVKGRFFYSHITDALRLVLLWRYGGTYLDSDVVILKNLDHLGTFAGNQGPPSYAVNGALLRFPKYHPLLLLAMEEYARRYTIPCGAGKCYSNDWIMVGPALLTWVTTNFDHITNVLDRSSLGDITSMSIEPKTDHCHIDSSSSSSLRNDLLSLPSARHQEPATNQYRMVRPNQQQQESGLNNIDRHDRESYFVHKTIRSPRHQQPSRHLITLNEISDNGPVNRYRAGDSIQRLVLTVFPPDAFYPVPWSSATKNQLTLVAPATSYDFAAFHQAMAFHMWNKLNALNGVTPFSFMDALLQQHSVFPRREEMMTMASWKARSFERMTIVFFAKERSAWLPSYMTKLITAYPGATIIGVLTFTKVASARRVDLSDAFNNADVATKVLDQCQGNERKYTFMAPPVKDDKKQSACAWIVLSTSSDQMTMFRDVMEHGVTTDYVMYLERGTYFRSPLDVTILLSFLHEENDFEIVIPAISIDPQDNSANFIIFPELYAFAADSHREDGNRADTAGDAVSSSSSCACKLFVPDSGVTGVHYGRGSVYLFRSSVLEGITSANIDRTSHTSWREDMFRRIYAIGGKSVFVNAISAVTEDTSEVGPLLRYDECKPSSIDKPSGCQSSLLPTEIHGVVLSPPPTAVNKEFFMIACTVINKDLVKHINEWIEYHLLQGFDHIVVYDMSEGYFNSYPSNQVTVVDVDFLLMSLIVDGKKQTNGYSFREISVICFDHAHRLYLDKSEWIIFLGANEYAQAISQSSSFDELYTFRDYVTSMNHHAAIILRAVVFSNMIFDGVNHANEGLIIETFTQRIADSWMPPISIPISPFTQNRLIAKPDRFTLVDDASSPSLITAASYSYSSTNFPVNDIGVRQWPSLKSYSVPISARIIKFFTEIGDQYNDRIVTDPLLFRTIKSMIYNKQTTYSEMFGQTDNSLGIWIDKLKLKISQREVGKTV